jgi:hypothetical protein
MHDEIPEGIRVSWGRLAVEPWLVKDAQQANAAKVSK